MALPCAVLAAACEAPGNSRSIMSGFPGHFPNTSAPPAQGQQQLLDQADSFNHLLMAAWGQPGGGAAAPNSQQQLQQAPIAASPRSNKPPAAYGSSPSDIQLRRDIDFGAQAHFASATPGAVLQSPPLSYPGLEQLQLQQQQQQYGGSSGPGSDTAGSVHQQQQQSQQDEAPEKPVKRGRGRQRKNTGVETAQQRAHRRFYERKKQRMAGLEQEAREKQEEYQQLLALNVELRRKHEALERAVAGRDEHLVLIQALGSLSLDASRARQQAGGGVSQHHQAHAPMPTLQEQQQQQQKAIPQQQPQQQQQQPPHAEPPLHHHRSNSSPMQPPTHSNSWSHLVQDSDMHRSGSAPSAPTATRSAPPGGWQIQQQQQPPEHLMPEVEEAGPFGMVQLPQYGSADNEALPVPANSLQAAEGTQPQQQQPRQETAQQMSWVAQQQQFAQWPAAGSLMDLLEGPGMSLTRSLSMPARTGGFDADFMGGAGDAFLQQQQQPVLGLGAPQPSRSLSTIPSSWNTRAGPLRAGAADASADDWDLGGGPFAAAALNQPTTQQQQPLLPPGSSRHHSWSGASTALEGLLPSSLVPRASLSFGVGPLPAAAGGAGGASGNAAAASPQQAAVQDQAAQEQRGASARPSHQGGSMWGTVTTAGPGMGGGVASVKGEQMAWPAQQQQQQQQEGFRMAPPQPAFPGFMPPPPPQQHQQHQQAPPFLQPRRSALQHVAPQQVVQQLQQMGDMAFSSDLTAQLATANVPDDILLFDADMMDMLMERMSQQQSVEMLSPLPSIPSALLTGDSLRAAMADPALAAALAASTPSPPSGGAGGLTPSAQQQQQAQQRQEQQQGLSGAQAAAGDDCMATAGGDPNLPALAVPPPGTAAAGGSSRSSRQSSPGSPLTLLEASRALQARHIAAGFYPSRSANEMFYVHEMVDWYKTKLLQLQQLLPYVDRPNPDVACGVSLVQTMEEVIDGVRKFGTRNRIGMWELKLINLETGDCEEAPSSHWSMVADHIQLPPQMRESAMACYSLYLEYVDKVKEDRVAVLRDFQLLEGELAAAAAASARASPADGIPRTIQFRADGYEQYQALIERLQLSLKREHMVANMLSYSLSQISSHVQMAKGMLSCWPYWPDGPSVLEHWLAEEQQAGGQRGGGVSSAGGGVAGLGGAVGGLLS